MARASASLHNCSSFEKLDRPRSFLIWLTFVNIYSGSNPFVNGGRIKFRSISTGWGVDVGEGFIVGLGAIVGLIVGVGVFVGIVVDVFVGLILIVLVGDGTIFFSWNYCCAYHMSWS